MVQSTKATFQVPSIVSATWLVSEVAVFVSSQLGSMESNAGDPITTQQFLDSVRNTVNCLPRLGTDYEIRVELSQASTTLRFSLVIQPRTSPAMSRKRTQRQLHLMAEPKNSS